MELFMSFAGEKMGSIKIQNFTSQLVRNLTVGMRNAGANLERQLKKSLSGGSGGKAAMKGIFFNYSWAKTPYLRSRSGNLRASINYIMGTSGMLPSVNIGPRKIPYAAIHEFGGTIPVTDKMRAFLHWKGVHLKKTTTQLIMPQRKWFEPVIKQEQAKTVQLIQDGIYAPLRTA